ncbi:MAG: fibronectin type III domain-containing protein [Patescibacteria group bacterium]|nr:Ig-like domain-containing protein [Patescibacteria group bacterium]
MYKKLISLLSIGALALLQAPTTIASSTLEVEAFDTIAGYSTTIEVENAISYRDIEILITKPNQSELILEGETDEDGELQLDMDGYHLKQAGNYEIKGKYSNENNYGQTDSFKVYEDSVSLNKSLLEADQSTAEATGYDPVKLSITLEDKYGNPINNHEISIISSRSGDYITPYSETKTNDQGKTTFYAYSDEVGISTYTAYDMTSNITLSGRAKVAFFSPTKTLKDIGGDNLFTSVLLASDGGEAGPVDHFEIEDIEEQVDINKFVNFTVTAYDENDLTVEDYTGTIRFGSSDDNSDLPNDYTFMAEDQGSHTFSLSLRFGTTGLHTLSITDIDDRDIEGEIEVQVGTEGTGNATVTPNTTEESDADFTLLTPQAGTYSLSTIEISGQAEYGLYIDIYDNSEILTEVFTTPDNAFSYEADLGSGLHQLYAVTKDADGNELETSETVSVTIDMDAPILDYVTISPEGDLAAGSTFSVEIFSEPNLNQAGIILGDKIYELQESITTKGVYKGTLLAPETEGIYELDIILVDTLANEIQYSNQATISVVEAVVVVEEEVVEIEEEVVVTPSDITGVEAINGDSRVTLTWEAAVSGSENTFIDHYKIYYGPDPELLFSTVETYDSSTTWYIPGLQNDTTYYFQVVAVDSEGAESLGRSATMEGTPEAEEVIEELGKLHESAEEPSLEETGTPEETPDSGPQAAWVLLFTIVFAEFYFKTKKKINQKI